jgi:transcriptional regulator with XRE-family HTH domain
MTGAELKKLRKLLGLSLTQASRQVEISTRTWARWEASEKVPNFAVEIFENANGLKKPDSEQATIETKPFELYIPPIGKPYAPAIGKPYTPAIGKPYAPAIGKWKPKK